MLDIEPARGGLRPQPRRQLLALAMAEGAAEQVSDPLLHRIRGWRLVAHARLAAARVRWMHSSSTPRMRCTVTRITPSLCPRSTAISPRLRSSK